MSTQPVCPDFTIHWHAFADGALKQMQSRYLIQLLLGLLLHSTDVIHGQLNPLVDAAEQLSVEVGEQPLLHLYIAGGWESAWEHSTEVFAAL